MFKDQVHNGYYESDYMLEDPAHDFIIDAADPKSCLGRYANDSLSMKKSNEIVSLHFMMIRFQDIYKLRRQ